MKFAGMRRAILATAAVATAAMFIGPATAANASSGGGCGGTINVYSGPFILANAQSCVGIDSGNHSLIDGFTFVGWNYDRSAWSSCTVHVSLRDDSIPTTVFGTTFACDLSGNIDYGLNGFPGVAGHHYHIYGWITGDWDGRSITSAVANSNELTF